MSWRKSIIFAVDCLAVLAAVAMAAPFVLILVSPVTFVYAARDTEHNGAVVLKTYLEANRA